MTARILVVDDVPANVKLLEARLLAEYFDVLTAGDGSSALAICENTAVDLVLENIRRHEAGASLVGMVDREKGY